MPTPSFFPIRLRSKPVLAALGIAGVLALTGLSGHRLSGTTAGNRQASGNVTTIEITPQILHSGVKRFGINLSGQTFYDSGQMLRNLIFRNPGFEGETWQSILHCKAVTANSCTDEQPYSAWPDGFLAGATLEVITGPAKGNTTRVQATLAAKDGHGVTVSFEHPLSALKSGDFVLAKMEKSGDAEAGWWSNLMGGASLKTEFHDLSPHTLGRQALRIDAASENQRATVSSYFDSMQGHSFLQIRGRYTLSFRAKSLGGTYRMPVEIARTRPFLQQQVPLTTQWQDYSYGFSADEDGSALGTVALTFTVEHASVLLDDVEVTATAAANNPTAFRNEVVDTLRYLNPGILRFMDNGTSYGSTLDDLLAPPLARHRAGSMLSSARAEDIPIGLHESLVLAQSIHAEPWYTLPATLSPHEAAQVIEYLAGNRAIGLGLKRAALGQAAPWTTVFPVIHLEFGNEMWGTSPGATIDDPAAYAQRAADIFHAMRSAQGFDLRVFDLVGDAQAENTWWTPHALATGTGQTSIDFAPYLFGSLNDLSSTEAIFAPMFAEPEQSSSTGLMARQVKLVHDAPVPVTPSVYEVNLGTVKSDNPQITQDQIDSTVASTGAGIAVADHMLTMLRELGITNQNLFSLPGYANRFDVKDQPARQTLLWGAVVDMGGATNRRRPSFYTLQLANRALLANEVALRISGSNPTWIQPATSNGNVKASQPHFIQVFAFADGPRRSLVLFNLSRDRSLPVNFSGSRSPEGKVKQTRFSSAHLTDTNEHELKASPVTQELLQYNSAALYMLPPFSMTLLEWQGQP